ncbi:LysR family transcriptional regulator [Acidomonas methanolica]|uniref:Transcriptional regulator LysR n=1 Tax=Acidomonas methanolica NBRC 104435 TaxID=1231351 RepID=A0A023D5L1_ACIMT|nr:LysR substrate-binding domain-containing protein [Acidomonas methanolica]MBU2655108.1 LysR family transcriptional regulator [Acidomonas methanolica]TCS29517.1 DNA-binding transcriptional LysR family regulator [Acidomonas methanolica]GAJ29359.1 transcriptional regulator LysR [Acidomonas methanolica NBRC 104435]GBQ46710.1 LysR family transcriptional regulator [Acidomonas methanolica]GEK99122.1 LysR family transcriptional regulator [Acidomonas methanolica NBRC 104435]
MKTRQLKYYLTVADELNFSRASEKLNIEASPLSRAIGDLESYFGVPFLHRRKGRIRLTIAGQVFREEAQHILDYIESVKHKVISANKGFRSQLRIGLTDGLVQPRIARLLALCREEEPQTAIRIATMDVRQMLDALERGHLDAAFTLDGEATGSYTKAVAWTERPAVALPIRHPLLARETIYLRDTKPYSFLVCHPETWSGGHYLLRKWFAETSSSLPREAVTASGHDTLMMLVGAGYGLGACLESRALTQPHPDVVFRPLGDTVSPAEILLVFKEPSPSPSLERFIERALRSVDSPVE